MLSDRTLATATALRGRVPFALMYHSVTAYTCDPYGLTVTAKRFARQMAWLHRCGLRGVSMRELLSASAAGRAGRLVGLTFDDGYADFLTDALPVLRRYGFGATVFALAGKLGGRNDWDLHSPVKFLLGPDQLREIAAAGIEIGSQGLGHRRLGDASETVLWLGLAQSRDILETVLGQPVQGFCYPYGELSDATMAAVAGHGYGYAVAIRPTGWRDRYALPRAHVREADTGPRLLAKLIRHRW